MVFFSILIKYIFFVVYLLTLDSDLLDFLWVRLHVVPPCFYSDPEGPKTFLNTILSYSYDYITALDSRNTGNTGDAYVLSI